MPDRFAGAVPYLRAFARVLGAHYHLPAALAEGGEGPRDRAGAVLHHAAAAGTCRHCWPMSREGAEELYALGPDDLAA